MVNVTGGDVFSQSGFVVINTGQITYVDVEGSAAQFSLGAVDVDYGVTIIVDGNSTTSATGDVAIPTVIVSTNKITSSVGYVIASGASNFPVQGMRIVSALGTVKAVTWNVIPDDSNVWTEIPTPGGNWTPIPKPSNSWSN